MGYVLYGLAEVQYLDRATKERMVTAVSEINGGIEIATTELDIKGGLNNKLIAKLFTDGVLTVNASDALFDFNYMKMVTGGDIEVGGSVIDDPEVVTVSVANTITVANTPVEWNGEICGWYSVGDENEWHKTTFIGKNATISGLSVGDTVCVQYNQAKNDGTLRQFKVPSSIVPDQITVIMKAGLFSSGTDDMSSASKVGDLIIEVPRFVFNGSTSLSFDNTGASTTDLSGSALVNYETSGCDKTGYYAIIKEFIPSRSLEDGLMALAVDGSDIQLDISETTALKVIGLYNGGATGVITNDNLTLVSSDISIATVSASGEIEAIGEGICYITATIGDYVATARVSVAV